MKKYEYRYVDLSSTWTLNPEKKMTELVERLNTLGQEGWGIVSGLEIVKYAVFVREIQSPLWLEDTGVSLCLFRFIGKSGSFQKLRGYFLRLFRDNEEKCPRKEGCFPLGRI